MIEISENKEDLGKLPPADVMEFSDHRKGFFIGRNCLIGLFQRQMGGCFQVDVINVFLGERVFFKVPLDQIDDLPVRFGVEPFKNRIQKSFFLIRLL